MIKEFRRIAFSVLTPLFLAWIWWKAFDGEYTRTDLFWLVGGSIILAVAIYVYLPLGRKIERFSAIWFLELLIMIYFVTHGLLGLGFWNGDIPDEFFSIARRAWGEYMLYLGLWIPVIHVSGKMYPYDRPNQWSLFKRIRLGEDASS